MWIHTRGIIISIVIGRIMNFSGSRLQLTKHRVTLYVMFCPIASDKTPQMYALFPFLPNFTPFFPHFSLHFLQNPIFLSIFAHE